MLPIVIGAAVVIGLIALATQSKDVGGAIENTLTRVKRKVMSSDRARAIAPLVGKWAAVFGAPPSLVMAILENESRFDPTATNLTSPGDVKRGGAWGLAQLTLQTALDLHKGNPATAKQYWPTWDQTGKGLLDPNINLAIACFGIARNWTRYKGKRNNWVCAGLAWNVGAGAMDKKIVAAEKSGDWSPILNNVYTQHIVANRNNNPLTAELFAQETQRKLFAYA